MTDNRCCAFVPTSARLATDSKRGCIMIRTFNIDKGQKPTDAQLQEIYEAKKKPIVFDKDSPELSPAMYKAFKSSVIQRNRKKNA